MNRCDDTCRSEWGTITQVSRLLRAREAARLDQAVIAGFGLSGLQLMEQAGAAAAAEAERIVPCGAAVWVLCGSGQNGGDGWVAARILLARGYAVRVFDFADGKELPPEAAHNRSAAVAAGVDRVPGTAFLQTECPETVCLVDALFGHGFASRRGLPESLQAAVRHMANIRAAGGTVLSLDVPSGIDASTGGVAEPCVQADTALAFMRAKVGQISHPGILQQTRLCVEPLGVTHVMLADILPGPGVYQAGAAAAALWLPPLAADRHKGMGGRAAVVGGSADMPGAAILAAKAMAMTGIGYTSILCAETNRSDFLQILPDALYPRQADADFISRHDAVAYGPGLGRERLYPLDELISQATRLVIDADGLSELADLPGWAERLSARDLPAVLTPHVGELRRLWTYDASDRVESALGLARHCRSIVVLKGMSSVVAAPDGNALIVTTGNAGMAKGGSGDVLTGIVAGFLAGGMPPLAAAATAAYVHGAAADDAAQRIGERALLPQDTVNSLPYVFKHLRAFND